MNFELKSLSLNAAALLKADGLIVLAIDGFKPAKDELFTVVDHALKTGDFETKAGKTLSLYRPTGFNTPRVVFAGAGDGSAKDVRQATVAAMGLLKGTKVKQLVICFADLPTDGALKGAVIAAAESSYVYTTTKSKPEGREIQRIIVGVPKLGKLKNGFDSLTATVSGVEFAKEWANRPANHATPTMLADAARSLAKFPKIKCEVLGPKEVEKLKMGAFMAVAQGSEEPLQFIVLRYDGAAKSQAPTVLVGKGITFDCGGVSIKPAAEMDEMKYDMCGAASVLGVFRALGELSPSINVIGLIPACENLINGRAVKPGDVVTSMSGQTIEILNTDAEGRLVLCDALTYAERFKPRAVIDIATLTGACVVALGAVRSGLFSNDEALVSALTEAGANSLDLCWRMPLDEDYAEGLKTHFADVANVAGRAGGAVTAAKFLQRFTAKFPWAHLDIAGTAWKSGAAKGATGRPVPLLLTYLTAPSK
jgi:leucyl aminopeptidase